MNRFYAILKGIVTTLLASTLLMTSCQYDDTDLRTEIKNLYELISQLEERIDNEVATLTTLINSQTVISEASLNEDGSWTLILSTGETIVVKPQNITDSYDTNGCITVKVVDGVYYWAIIVDGEVIPLTDSANNNVAVAGNTPVFRVNDNSELEFSVDGENWYPIPEVDGSKLPNFSYFITNVEENNDMILFYLASGDVISVQKALVVDFGVKVGKTYIKAGDSATIGLIVENISDLTVIDKPEGWRAVISDKNIVVTAPSAEKIANGSADLEGVIKIHATSTDGKCMVGKLSVSASEQGLTITISGDNVSIYHNQKDSQGNFLPLYYGIESRSDFSADALASMYNNQKQTNSKWDYEGGVTLSIKELYNQIHNDGYATNPENAVAIPSGFDYVIWAIVDPSTYENPYVFSGEDFSYTIYTPAHVTMKTTKVSFNEIEISVKAGGYDSYQAGVIEASSEAEAIDILKNNFGNFQQGWGAMGENSDNINYTGSIANFFSYYDSDIFPDSGYLAFVLPITKDRPEADYQFEDIHYLFAKSNNLTDGGNGTITSTASSTFNTINASLSASAGTIMIYAKILTAAEMTQYTDDSAIINHLMKYCAAYDAISFGDTATVSARGLNSGETATLCAFAVDKNGRRGELYRAEYTTSKLTFSDSMKVTIDENASKVNINSVSVKFNVSGGTPAKYIYAAVSENSWLIGDFSDAASAATYLALNSTSYGVESIDASEVTNNFISVGDLDSGVKYTFAMIAVDGDGIPSQAAMFYFTPNIPSFTIVRNSDERWAATKPSYTINKWFDADYGAITYNFSVTIPDGVISCCAALTDTEYMPIGQGAKVGIDKLLLATSNNLQYGGSIEFIDDYTSPNILSFSSEVYFHLTWSDADGNYYQAIEEHALPELIAQSNNLWKTTQPSIVYTSNPQSREVNYTVTPGENNKRMWIYFIPQTNYSEADYLTHTMMLGRPDVVECSEEYSATATAASNSDYKEAAIYVAWEDNDGNLYILKRQKCFPE